nr:hypothetical protein CFP56_55320 [Quercus suber]
MPPRKKAMGILTGVGENHLSEPSANHISMHSEGIESSSKASHHENRNTMAIIEDLQRSQAVMLAEFQSLRQEIAIPQAPQAKKLENAVYVDTRPPYPEEIAGKPYPVGYTPLIFPKVAKGYLVIKARKMADLRMCRPKVAMTFFMGREDPMEEEAENMASSSSTPPPLVDEEMITRIQ